MEKGTNVQILPFVKHELDALRGELHANGMKISNQGDLVNALILAARRSPIEAVAAVVNTYWEREAEEAPKVPDGSGSV